MGNRRRPNPLPFTLPVDTRVCSNGRVAYAVTAPELRNRFRNGKRWQVYIAEWSTKAGRKCDCLPCWIDWALAKKLVRRQSARSKRRSWERVIREARAAFGGAT